jgi:hypothetical protein
MQFFSPIEAPEGADLEAAASAVVAVLDDEASKDSVLEILKAGQVVTPAEYLLKVQVALEGFGIKMVGPLNGAVAIPGQALEQALPKAYRPSVVISRLLGEESGDVPTSAVYDMVDLLTSIDEPEAPEEVALIGEVLARAVMGVTAGIPDGIQQKAGLIDFRNAYTERLSALIDPDAEAAPADSEE